MIKKITKKKKLIISIALVLALALIAGGLYLYRQKGIDQENNQDESVELPQSEEEIQENLAEKEKQAIANQDQDAAATTDLGESTTTTGGVLTDVAITAINDGTNIYLSLYGPAGNYDVEKCFTFTSGQCISGWTKKVSNQYYVGHGGLAIDTWSQTETEAVYRINKLVNGVIVATSKNILIDRNFSGTKTFTGA